MESQEVKLSDKNLSGCAKITCESQKDPTKNLNGIEGSQTCTKLKESNMVSLTFFHKREYHTALKNEVQNTIIRACF